jgi:hypothetical protein
VILLFNPCNLHEDYTALVLKTNLLQENDTGGIFKIFKNWKVYISPGALPASPNGIANIIEPFGHTKKFKQIYFRDLSALPLRLDRYTPVK